MRTPLHHTDVVTELVAIRRRILWASSLAMLAVYGLLLFTGQYGLAVFHALSATVFVAGNLMGSTVGSPASTELLFAQKGMSFLRAEGRTEGVLVGLRRIVEGFAAHAGIPAPAVSLFVAGSHPVAVTLPGEHPHGHVIVAHRVVKASATVACAVLAHEVGHIVINREVPSGGMRCMFGLVGWTGRTAAIIAILALLMLDAGADRSLPILLTQAVITLGVTCVRFPLVGHLRAYNWETEFAADEIAARLMGDRLIVSLALIAILAIDEELDQHDVAGFTHPSMRERMRRLTGEALVLHVWHGPS